MQVMNLGRAPRTRETLPNFLKWRRITRHPLVFRELTSSQRTPGFGASQGVNLTLKIDKEESPPFPYKRVSPPLFKRRKKKGLVGEVLTTLN